MAKTSTSFKKGESKGRPKGAVNQLTKTVRDTVMAVFNNLQSDPIANLESWAKDQPTEFYKIASKLIPSEINASVEVITPKLPDFMKANESES
jgi:hypothetical protein